MLYIFTHKSGRTITVDALTEHQARQSLYEIGALYFPKTSPAQWKLLDVRPFVPAANGHKTKTQINIQNQARRNAHVRTRRAKGLIGRKSL